MKKLLLIFISILLISFSAYSQKGDSRNALPEKIPTQNLQRQLQLIPNDVMDIQAYLTETSKVKSAPQEWYILAASHYSKWDTEISGWECKEKTLYAYDNNYRWTVRERQKAEGSVPIQKYEYYYDDDGDDKVDEVRTYDYISSEWVPKKKDLYYYDSITNNLAQVKSKYWNGSEVEDYSKTDYAYKDNRITGYEIKYYVDSVWVNNSKRNYEYDVSNNLHYIKGEAWDYEKNVWVQFSKLEYKYDNLTNNLYQMLFQYWDDEDNYWKNSLKGTFHYTDDNYQYKTLYEQYDDEGFYWYKSSMYEYFYLLPGSERVKYKNNNLDKPIEDFQTTEDEIVVNQSSKLGTDMSLIGIEVLIDSVLHSSDGDLEFTLSHNGISDTLIYQAGGEGDNFIGTKLMDNGVLDITEGVAPFASSYKSKNSLSRFIETDPSGVWTLSIYDGAAGNNGVLKSWGLNLIYASTSSIYDPPINDFSFDLYPNPAVSVISLQLAVGSRRDAPMSLNRRYTIILFDLNGRKLLEKHIPAGTENIDIDVSNLKNGVYFCHLFSEKYSAIKKLIIRK